MADRILVIEIEEIPGHLRPGIQLHSASGEYTPETKDAHTLGVYATFVGDASIATIADGIATSLATNGVADTYP